MSQFPLESMHLICLGVIKRLISIRSISYGDRGDGVVVLYYSIKDGEWLESSCHTILIRRAGHCKSLNDGKQLSIGCFSNTLDQLHWKASCHMFIQKLPHAFSCCPYVVLLGLTILQRSCKSSSYSIFQKVTSFSASSTTCSFHALSHLASHPKRFGPLDQLSNFPFENKLQSIKWLLRKPCQPLQQNTCIRYHSCDVINYVHDHMTLSLAEKTSIFEKNSWKMACSLFCKSAWKDLTMVISCSAFGRPDFLQVSKGLKQKDQMGGSFEESVMVTDWDQQFVQWPLHLWWVQTMLIWMNATNWSFHLDPW